jgi:hypothetical protein
MKAEVRVSKAGPDGIPLVQVAIDRNATPDQIASAIRAVYANPAVYQAAGVREHLTCKSGIHVATVDAFSESIFVDSD